MKFWDASAIVPLLVAEEIDPTAAGACCEGFRYARMVGIRSRMHFCIGSPRT